MSDNINKKFVLAQELNILSLELGNKIIESKFEPTFILALWRGGAQIGVYVQELLAYTGTKTDHIAIRTSRYKGINQASETIQVHNLGYPCEQLCKQSKLLIVDDVYESGLSINAVITELGKVLGDNMPEVIKVATVFYKPEKNVTSRVPDYYVEESNDWIVFSHELEGLTLDEIYKNMGQTVGDIVTKAQNNKQI